MCNRRYTDIPTNQNHKQARPQQPPLGIKLKSSVLSGFLHVSVRSRCLTCFTKFSNEYRTNDIERRFDMDNNWPLHLWPDPLTSASANGTSIHARAALSRSAETQHTTRRSPIRTRVHTRFSQTLETHAHTNACRIQAHAAHTPQAKHWNSGSAPSPKSS